MKYEAHHHPAMKATAERRRSHRRLQAGSRTTSRPRAGKGGSRFRQPAPTKLKGRPSRPGYSRPQRSTTKLRVAKMNITKPSPAALSEAIASRIDCLLGVPITDPQPADCFLLPNALLACGDMPGLGPSSEERRRQPDKKKDDHKPGCLQRARRRVAPQLTQPKPNH